MKLEVNLSKKYFFILLGSILILAGVIYVNAQDPAIFGHDVSEIGGIPECSANQYLTFVDGVFLCETDQIGGGGVQACRTCFRTAWNNNGWLLWTSWYCTDYAYPGNGLQTNLGLPGEVILGYQIGMECI